MDTNNHDITHIPIWNSFRYMGEVDSLSNIPIDSLCVGDIYTYEALEYVYIGKNSNEEWIKLSEFKELDEAVSDIDTLDEI